MTFNVMAPLVTLRRSFFCAPWRPERVFNRTHTSHERTTDQFGSDERLGQSFYNMVDYVADRIADESEIRRSKQFPYQYFAAYLNADDNVPQKIKTALHKAAEIASGNVPELPGPVVIGLDTSGSMSSGVTGHRGRGVTSKMRCIDVAALFAAAILRRNPDSVIIPFDTSAYDAKIDPNDLILSIAERLAKYDGGGIDCSLPLVATTQKHAKRRFAGIVPVSDNESWVGSTQRVIFYLHGFSRKGALSCATKLLKIPFFEPMSKRRRGFSHALTKPLRTPINRWYGGIIRG